MGQYDAIRTRVGAVEVARDFVRVSGPEAIDYLQGQLSQDVAAVGAGESALSFLLEPQGKVVALLRLTRLADDEFLLDTDGGYGESVAERLARFKLRTKVTMETVDWQCVALRGPNAHEITNGDDAGSGAELVLPADWPGLAGVDLLGPDVLPPPDLARADDAYEAVRIEAGVPRMGAELTERTIPEETGVVERAVSFTKGCYTGQELVARIDSRGGNVARRLRGVTIEDADGALPPPGAKLTRDGRDVGEVTSVARRPGGAVALAYVRRGNEPPLDAEVMWEGGSGVVRIEALPLIS